MKGNLPVGHSSCVEYIRALNVWWQHSSSSQVAERVLCLQDIDGFVWSKSSRGCQLTVKRSSGPVTQFLGFIDKVGCHPSDDVNFLRLFHSYL